TWTMDPMVARNARFNLHKLGAVADRFHRDYYGPMEDAFNRGERSDRIEIRWELRSEGTERAMRGEPRDPATIEAAVLVRVPEDYHELRDRDPDAARRWRDEVADALERAFGDGYVATGFLREGAYVLERA
ncbi:MAG: hypothetical protein ACRDH1_11220, partial [Actinomycetota bacterium]